MKIERRIFANTISLLNPALKNIVKHSADSVVGIVAGENKVIVVSLIPLPGW